MASFHLQGLWSVTVRANWRIIFSFATGNADDVELVDYYECKLLMIWLKRECIRVKSKGSSTSRNLLLKIWLPTSMLKW